MKTVVLIYGLPGSGKTTLARLLHQELKCPWFNADEVRASLSMDLGFSYEDRQEQARRLGAIASLALRHSVDLSCIVDFVNPTMATWDRFHGALQEGLRVYSIFMDTIWAKDCRFLDTAILFDRAVANRRPDFVVSGWHNADRMQEAAHRILAAIRNP